MICRSSLYIRQLNVVIYVSHWSSVLNIMLDSKKDDEGGRSGKKMKTGKVGEFDVN